MERYGDLTHGALWGDEDDWEHLAPHTPYTVSAKQCVGSVYQPEDGMTVSIPVQFKIKCPYNI